MYDCFYSDICDMRGDSTLRNSLLELKREGVREKELGDIFIIMVWGGEVGKSERLWMDGMEDGCYGGSTKGVGPNIEFALPLLSWSPGTSRYVGTK